MQKYQICVCYSKSLYPYTLFVESPRYLEVPFIDFCETSQNRRQEPKV